MSKTILFVCRGNAFRSIMAEAYAKSKQLPDIIVQSSGTVASQHYEGNNDTFARMRPFLISRGIGDFAKDHYGRQLRQEHLDSADIVVLVNEIVLEEIEQQGFRLPSHTHIWDVTDIGEPGRIPKDESERQQYWSDVYDEISMLVDTLLDLEFAARM